MSSKSFQNSTKLNNLVLPSQFGAIGNGTTNDTAAFLLLEASVTGETINLCGVSYVVDSIPSANTYVNGIFIVSGVSYRAANERASISGNQQGYGIPATDNPYGTGSFSTGKYTGGTNHTPTTAGRTNTDTYTLIASEDCVSEGAARAVNVGSIYSWSKGNVSGNYSSRQSLAWVPQSANLASEECRVVGGFRGANVASIYSGCENESNANIACRSSFASSRNGVNIASSGSYSGKGGGAILVANVSSGGVLTSVSIAVGNDGTTTFPGAKYTVGDTVSFFDPLATSPVYPVVTVATVDANGAITGFTYVSYGSGLTPNGLQAKIDNGTGDFSSNIATTNCVSSGSFSTNLACADSTASATCAGNYSGDGNTASANYSSTVSSINSTASGVNSTVIAGSGSSATGVLSAGIAVNLSQATADGAVIFGRRTINSVTRSIAFGDSATGSASTANRKFHLLANGALSIASTLTQNAIFTDYAEFFENLNYGEIPLGTLVSLDGRKVRPAQNGDFILGVVSGTASIAAGDSPFHWAKRYVTGEFGEMLYQSIPDPDWQPVVDGAPNPRPQEIISVPIENSDYRIEEENIPRSQRKSEWTCVGLLGQVHVRLDSNVQPGDFIFAGTNGIGFKANTATNLICMEIRNIFNSEKGYAVGFCLLK